jgi:hypothetical protein
VLSVRGLFNELITRPGESYRLWCVVVQSGNIMNEQAMTHFGPQLQRKKIQYFIIFTETEANI